MPCTIVCVLMTWARGAGAPNTPPRLPSSPLTLVTPIKISTSGMISRITAQPSAPPTPHKQPLRVGFAASGSGREMVMFAGLAWGIRSVVGGTCGVG